jgi:hypothetical protein
VEEAGVDSKPGILVANDVSRRTVWCFAVGWPEAENDEDDDDEEDSSVIVTKRRQADFCQGAA